jgi:hypothetical protein
MQLLGVLRPSKMLNGLQRHMVAPVTAAVMLWPKGLHFRHSELALTRVENKPELLKSPKD